MINNLTFMCDTIFTYIYYFKFSSSSPALHGVGRIACSGFTYHFSFHIPNFVDVSKSLHSVFIPTNTFTVTLSHTHDLPLHRKHHGLRK